MTDCWLTCPAYPLPDAAARCQTLAIASELAKACDWGLLLSPLLHEPGPRGSWQAAAIRLADARQACTQAEVLWAVRGGYGCLDLLPLWQSTHADGLPIVCGFSDLTVLHSAAWVRGARPGLYGLMPAVPHGPQAIASFIAAAAGESARHSCRGARSGRARGRLFAACLRILAGLCGSWAQPDLRGCVLAIEDIDEPPYAIDRDLTQLFLAGVLDGITGLVGGPFTWDAPADHGGPGHAAILTAWGERLQVPVALDLSFGHVADPVALSQGRPCQLVVDDEQAELAIAAGAPLV